MLRKPLECDVSLESQLKWVIIASELRACQYSMKIRDVIDLLTTDGWYFVGQRGSHRQFRHPVKPGKVTVAGAPGKDVSLDMFKSILRQSGIKEDKR